MRKPNAEERKPLRAISPYVMATILAEIEKAERNGYSADEIARHFWSASVRPLARTVEARYFLADILTAWASQVESDARAEAATRAHLAGDPDARVAGMIDATQA